MATKSTAVSMWVVESENLTQLGGPMGSEYTTTNWRKYFSDPEKAKTYAQKDYDASLKAAGSASEKIKWKKSGRDFTSGDLRFVMYTVSKVKAEDA